VSVIGVFLAGLVLSANADDERIIVPKTVQDMINKMADEIGKGNDVDKDAKVFFRAAPDDLRRVKWVFKPRTKDGDGGFGIGAKPGPYQIGGDELPDGIEAVIIKLGNPRHPALKADDLKKAAPDLKRMADVVLAMAEITQQYKPAKKQGDLDPKDWTKFTDEMRVAAKDLKSAVDMNKPDATKVAFTKLYASCTRCHAVFVDDFICVPLEMKEAVNKMADAIAKGNKVDKEADAFFNDHKSGLKRTMWVFTPRFDEMRGGFGVGKPGEYKPDGIEDLILNQCRLEPSTQLDLKTSAGALNRLADVTLAVSEITTRYRSLKAVGDKDPKRWDAANADMARAAVALKQAVKAENTTEAKRAFRGLGTSCAQCHEVFCEAGRMDLVIPQPIRDALNGMADSVAKGEKIDKAADAFFKDQKADFKTVQGVFKPRTKNGKGGFGIGPIPGVYEPDEITRFIARHGVSQTEPFTKAQLPEVAEDLNRLGDVLIVMAEVTQRYKPKAIVIGRGEISNPAEWTKAADAMSRAAANLKTAVKANRPDDVRRAFRDLDNSCTTCHLLFR
jgi:cytochrome c556